MKILHFNVYKHLLPGIKHQLIDEQSAAKELDDDIEWSTVIFSLDKPIEPFMKQANTSDIKFIPKKLTNYIHLKKQAYQWLLENHHRYDLVLLRYFSGDPFLFYYIKRMTNIFTIHHTLEHYESSSTGGSIGYLHGKFDQFIAPYILEQTIGIIGVTNEIREYELNRIKHHKKSYTYPNGVITHIGSNIIDRRTNQIKIAFIASDFLPWHGLDIVQEQFKKSKLPIQMEVIGHVPEELKIKDQRITYHGLLDKNQIALILSSVDIGLSCFALERKGMKEACTLKVREYLANGIPVYASHIDSALPKQLPYYINQPFSLEYVYEMASQFKSVSRTQIIKASEKFIDKSTQMKHLINWLKDASIKNNSQP